MTQYLLTIYQPDGGPPPPEVMEPVVRKLHALNQDLKAAGAWVFSRGLHAASTATVAWPGPGGGRSKSTGPITSCGTGPRWEYSAFFMAGSGTGEYPHCASPRPIPRRAG